MKWIIFAFRNVLRNRRRSVVTSLIGAVGVASLLCAFGFAAYSYYMLKLYTGLELGHVIVAQPELWTKDEDLPLQYGLKDYRAISTAAEQDPRVAVAVARIMYNGLLSNGTKSMVFLAEGVEPRQFRVTGPTRTIVQGRFLSEHPDAQGDVEVILGKQLAKSLKVGVGSGVTLMVTTSTGALNAIDAQVVGIFSTGLIELDKRLLYTNLQTAQELLQTDKVSKLTVFLHNVDDSDKVMHDLRQRLEAKWPGLGYRTWESDADYYRSIKAIYNRVFSILGIIIGVVVFFSVSNTMSMAVLERTREIGTLRALGALPGQIVRNFVLEAMVMGFGAMIGGLLITTLVIYGVQWADLQMPPPPMRLVGYPLRIYFVPLTASLVSFAIILVCMLAAYGASRRAARRPIVEALAYV